MRKYLIVAFAALVSLAACTKVVSVEAPEDEITFNVVNYALQTRATQAYSTEDSFGTYAYWTATNWATDGDANVFMDNEKISYGPSYATTEWGPASQYYWTKTGAITFASYSPYVSAAGSGFSAVPTFDKTNGFKFPNYTVVADTDVDVMVADLVTDQTKNNPQYKVSSNTDGVPTLFHHVMTKVGFLFKAGENPNANGGCEIVLKDVKIQSIYNKGSYTQNKDTVWTAQSGEATYVFNAAADTVTLKAGADAREPKTTPERILLPQELGTAATAAAPAVPGPQQLVISYTVRTKYGDNWVEEDVTSTVDLYSDEIPSWDPNMSVVYTITINPVDVTAPVLFDPAVVDWDAVPGAVTIG